MKLSIRARLTIATAVMTFLLFVPAAVALLVTLTDEIRGEGRAAAELAARSLASGAVQQWDDDLMDEYDGGDPLGTFDMRTPHWALLRGDGCLVRGGGYFAEGSRVQPGEDALVLAGGEALRVVSVPLVDRPREDALADLPPAVQAISRRASPSGTFLRAKRQASDGRSILEISMLEETRIKEFEVTLDGEFLEGVKKKYDEEVPADLAARIREQSPLEEMVFSSWTAHNGQLIAVISGRTAGGEIARVAVNRLGERFLLGEDGKIRGRDPASRLWLAVATDASGEIAAIARLRATLGLALPLLWAAVVFVGWYVTRRALSPVHRIVDAVRQIEISRLDERLPVGAAGDELDRISSTINGMLDRIEAGYVREREFTGDAAHELRGPLAKIIADIEVALSRKREAADYRDSLLRCRSYARGMQRLVESLLWLVRLESRQEALRSSPFELTDLATETVKLLPEDEARRVRLCTADDWTGVVVCGAPELVRIMLQNLLQNALRYSPNGSAVALRLSAENGLGRVEVEDRGEGIPEDQIDRVFSRFFRVDKSRSRETGGFGLGLSIVHEVAVAHGTRVSLQNVPGGLRASFSLPLVAPDAA